MRYLWAAAAVLALAAIPALAETEMTFERTLAVSGHVELDVATGAGSIHLTRGTSNQVHVFGRVRSNWGGSDDMVREIAAHPAIEQVGNIVRIGERHQNLHNISIDYEVEAPADAYLDAATGSGSINDDGIGTNAKLSTGSGSIRATGLQGGFSLGTGSGSIELRGIHGGLRAHTGSGAIKAEGTPTGPWHLGTGSGSVQFWSGNSAFTLDASSGSGGIHSDREMLTMGTSDRHHLTGKIGGGGPTVRIETGSGSVRVH
jgi:hypothetical protein